MFPFKTFKIDNDRVAITGLKNTKSIKKLIIPSFYAKTKYNSFTVYAIYREAFKNNLDIEIVDIPNTIRYIEAGAFEGCCNLKEVYISSSQVDLGKNAFKNCHPNLVVEMGYENKYIVKNGNLQRIPHFVNDKDDLFCGEELNGEITITGLTEKGELSSDLTIPSVIDNYLVTRIDGFAFQDCKNIISITMDSITKIDDYAFCACDYLESLTINNSYPPTISSNTFDNTPNLTTIYVPTSAVEKYKKAFDGNNLNIEPIGLEETMNSVVDYTTEQEQISLKDYYNALINEKNNSSYNGRITLYEGIKLGNLYQYEYEGKKIQEESIVTIIHDNYKIGTGTIIKSGDNSVLLNCYKDNLPSQIEIEIEIPKVYENLCDRMEEIFSNQKIYPIAAALINPPNIKTPSNKNNINSNRIGKGNILKAINNTSEKIMFIWGPPGTGKTHTLAEITQKFEKEKKSILIVSFSNIAVDEVAQRIKNVFNTDILRYGYPERIDGITAQNIVARKIVEKNNPGIFERYKDLINKGAYLSNTELNEISKIRNFFKEEEKAIVNSRNHIATTIIKSIISDCIYDRKFDIVIIDEASMLTVPQVLFAASLATEKLIIIGDFQQLPPITQNEILEKDIYDYTGIRNAVNNNYEHPWLYMLNEQYRFPDSICQFISKTMYNGLLETINDNDIDFGPYPYDDIVIVDTTDMFSLCNKLNSNNSRYNVLNAFTSLSIALQYPNKTPIGIITPYKEQARLLRAIIRDIKSNNNDYDITCSTVHSFQGSEKDIIIYDVCDCPRSSYPPTQLLIGNTADRLFNVAISRTKRQFVMVVNRDAMELKKHLKESQQQKIKLLQEKNFYKLINDSSAINDAFDSLSTSDGTSKFKASEESRILKTIICCLRSCSSVEFFIPGAPKSSLNQLINAINTNCKNCTLTFYYQDKKTTNYLKKLSGNNRTTFYYSHNIRFDPLIIITTNRKDKFLYYGAFYSTPKIGGNYNVNHYPFLLFSHCNSTINVLHDLYLQQKSWWKQEWL